MCLFTVNRVAFVCYDRARNRWDMSQQYGEDRRLSEPCSFFLFLVLRLYIHIGGFIFIQQAGFYMMWTVNRFSTKLRSHLVLVGKRIIQCNDKINVTLRVLLLIDRVRQIDERN